MPKKAIANPNSDDVEQIPPIPEDEDSPEVHLAPEMEAFLQESEAQEPCGPGDSTESEISPIPQTDCITEDSSDSKAPEPCDNESSEEHAESVPTEKQAPKKRRTKKTDEVSEAEPQPKNPPVKKPRQRKNAIVSIDETRSVETASDKRKNDLLDMVESMKSKKILSGTVQGVERSTENPDLSFAVIYHGEFKVIIPASQMVEQPESYRDRSPGDVMHYMLTKRLGSEIDYIVKGVDKSGVAAASRLEAMAAKRKQYYFGTDRDGNNLLYEGINAEARVVAVIRAGIFVDLFGLEVYISQRELSYQRGYDASALFQPGQRVLVKILTIDRSDRDKIKVTASVKQATENPYAKALNKYVEGCRYVGTVSLVDTNGVFVSLDGGVDCLCSYPKRGRPPRGSRVTVRIVGINRETNRIWGAITHMVTAR